MPSLSQQFLKKLPQKPVGFGSIPLPSFELALHTEEANSWGSVVTGSSANVWRKQVGVMAWELGEGILGL